MAKKAPDEFPTHVLSWTWYPIANAVDIRFPTLCGMVKTGKGSGFPSND